MAQKAAVPGGVCWRLNLEFLRRRYSGRVLVEFILYATPVGPLAEQLELYFSRAEFACRRNTAHDFPPHITLTGFFWDESHVIQVYVAALEHALTGLRLSGLDKRIDHGRCIANGTFHYLKIESAWLQDLAVRFASHADSSTRNAPIRVKDWLHLSLAYGFPAEQSRCLEDLAAECIKVDARAEWEASLYERALDGSWRVHARMAL